MNKIPKSNWLSPKVIIKETDKYGKGIFTIYKIKQGEDVIIWGGNNYTNLEEIEKVDISGNLIMQWDEDLYSIEDSGEEDAYFVNHSCEPNIWMNDAFTLVAKRDIEAGEEILADYALWECKEEYISRWECNCGNQNCRSKITGNDWKNKELQEKYKNHFSPLINKKIQKG